MISAGGLAAIPAVSVPVSIAPRATVGHQSFATGSLAIDPPVRDAFTATRPAAVQWPLAASTPISDGYGARSCSGCSAFHEGIDFTPGSGAPVAAIADGIVVESEFSGELGQHVILGHVIDGVAVLSVYGHLRAGSNAVAVGDAVTRGQTIGLVGSTGRSTGPHLHFGIEIDGSLIDPLPWLIAHAAV